MSSNTAGEQDSQITLEVTHAHADEYAGGNMTHRGLMRQVGELGQGTEGQDGLHGADSKPSNCTSLAVMPNNVETAMNNPKNINQPVEPPDEAKDAPRMLN